MFKAIDRKIIMNICMLALCLLFIFLASIDESFAFLSFMSIIPMVLIGMEANILFSTSAAIVLCALSFLMGDLQFAFLSSFVYILPSLVSGICMANETHISVDKLKFRLKFKKGDVLYKFASLKTFLLSIAFFAIGSLLYTAILKYNLGLDLVKNLHMDIATILDLYKKNLSAQEYTTIKESGLIDFLSDSSSLYLLITYIKSIIMALVAYYLCISLSRFLYKEKIHNIKIDSIYLPGRPVLVLLVTIIVLYAIDLSLPNLDLISVINNFILIMNLLFFLEGASLIVFLIKNWKFVKREANMLIIFVVVIFMGILPGIAILGMLDNILNYRNRWYSDKESGGDRYGK